MSQKKIWIFHYLAIFIFKNLIEIFSLYFFRSYLLRIPWSKCIFSIGKILINISHHLKLVSISFLSRNMLYRFSFKKLSIEDMIIKFLLSRSLISYFIMIRIELKQIYSRSLYSEPYSKLPIFFFITLNYRFDFGSQKIFWIFQKKISWKFFWELYFCQFFFFLISHISWFYYI